VKVVGHFINLENNAILQSAPNIPLQSFLCQRLTPQWVLYSDSSCRNYI